MQKTITAIVISLVVLCLSFGSGYLTGYFRKNHSQGGSSSSNSEQIDRIVELTREYLVRERAGLESERVLIGEQRIQLERDRAELERERTLFARQRDLVVTDRADLGELAKVLEEIRDLAQGKK